MQLSSLYANRPEVFEPINFNCRDQSDTLNVIYGAVTDPKNQKQDSHNLGKTTLIHVIDFMCLKDIAGSNHFFETHSDRFKMLVFYFEIATNDGDYITVRRSVTDHSKIALVRHPDNRQNFSGPDFEAWDHEDLAVSAARAILDGILDLRIIAPYDFRKALTYFLRTQADYNDVLQLQKFQVGQHKFWKPFVMTMLGFDEKPVMDKYELDTEIDGREEDRKKKEAELQVGEKDLLRMNAEIQNLRAQLQETEGQLDRFEFSSEERRMMHELVNEIESRIVEINDQLYNLTIDIRNIDKALTSKIDFKIGDIEKIFEEVDLHFPDQIRKSYQELVTFNSALSRERNATLRKRRQQLTEDQSALRDERNEQDGKRQKFHSILHNSDTLDKFKSLQRNLSNQRAELTYLEGQYERLNAISTIETEINELKRERSKSQDLIKSQILKSTPPKDRVAQNFRTYCKRVLDHDGLFYLNQNSAGNVEFHIELKEKVTSNASRQSEGKSYKQILCALFDLALLKAYEDAPFFHFVYHDGILEGLDNRKKCLFLELVRELIQTAKFQYILSVIDTDIPRDANDNRVEFDENEIILRLHDGGDQGRLFKMSEF